MARFRPSLPVAASGAGGASQAARAMGARAVAKLAARGGASTGDRPANPRPPRRHPSPVGIASSESSEQAVANHGPEAKGSARASLARRFFGRPQHKARAFLTDFSVYVPPVEDFVTKAELVAGMKSSVSPGGCRRRSPPAAPSRQPLHPPLHQGWFDDASVAFMTKVINSAGLNEKVETREGRGRNERREGQERARAAAAPPTAPCAPTPLHRLR